MCFLKIQSETVSFLEYSKNTGLAIVSCHVKGRPRRGHPMEQYTCHRLSIAVSDKDWNDFEGQVSDAISFLTEHERELTHLIEVHEATAAYLDFPLYSRLNGDIINQNDHLPRELIKLAGRIGLGIEMAIYDKQAFDEMGAS